MRKLTLTFSRAPGNSSHLLVTRGLRPATGAGAGALLCCAIFALPGARRRKRLGTFLGLLVLVLAGLGTACRDSSGGSAGATSGVVQPGTYPVTVIVKSGPVVEATMKFNLEVR